MIKKTIFVFILLAFLPFTVHASALQSWNIDVAIESDITTKWLVTLNYENNVDKSDYYIPSDIYNLKVYADNSPVSCQKKKYDIGTSILCENLNASIIEYNFNVNGLIKNHNTLREFTNRFSVTQPTEEFTVSVKLPLGSYLAEQSQVATHPFEPVSGVQSSDGRRIYIQWNLHKPAIGKSIDVSVIYETASKNEFLIVLLSILLFILILVSFFFYKRKTIDHILPVLTEDERKVMEIVLNTKKLVDQREIVKRTDFSKSKISRIIKNLCERKLIEKIPKGRNNIIKPKLKGRIPFSEEKKNKT